MCTNNDIHLSYLQIGKHLFDLFCTSCPADIFHSYRKILETFAEGLIMLIGQNGSRNKHSNLFTIGSRLESSTDGHLGLTESYISTHQTIHRLRLFHIGFHILRCLELVGGIFIDETCLQLMLHIAVSTVGKACLLHTLRIKTNQVTSDVLHLLLHPLFHTLPCTCTQAVQSWGLTFPTLVFRYFIEGMNRHIDNIVVLIDNLDHLLHLPIRRHQTTELTHTMIYMHHIITDSELLYFLQGESHLSPTGFIALQAIFMIAIEQLMIGKVALLYRMVNETFMDGRRYWCKRYQHAALTVCIEDILQTSDLFIVICKYIDGIAFTDQSFKLVRHQLEVLMEQWLGTCVKTHMEALTILCLLYNTTANHHLSQLSHIFFEFRL